MAIIGSANDFFWTNFAGLLYARMHFYLSNKSLTI